MKKSPIRRHVPGSSNPIALCGPEKGKKDGKSDRPHRTSDETPGWVQPGSDIGRMGLRPRQEPFDARTGKVIGTMIQEQTAQCLRNIVAILQAAGSSLEQAVSATSGVHAT